MGYIHDLENELTEMLDDLEEVERDRVIKYVKDKVWQSYKNGKAEVDRNGERKPKRFSQEKGK